ncbi:MAG: hypothetical protein RLZZ225_1114 [Pseudomonadota bacterium]|jgi:DNA-binding transcriptional regulator YdaS (Cro superfamily)
MQEAMLDKAIYSLGSVKHMAKKLGVHREHIYAWIKGVSKIPLEFALQIECLTGGEINWKDLVPFHIAQRLKHLSLYLPKFDLPPCELVYVAIERIKFSKAEMIIDKSDGDTELYKQRPICLDQDNTLIFGEKSLHIYKNNLKKTIPAWRLSLVDLINGNYSSELFIKNFLISERVAVGIALERFLGSRQGYRSDLNKVSHRLTKIRNTTIKTALKTSLRNNDAQVLSGKLIPMRQLIANLLGFGSHFTYQNAKKIKLYGDTELIAEVDRQKLSLSKAANFCDVSGFKTNKC